MYRIEWTDALSVGIAEMDRQHQQIIAMINRMNAARGTKEAAEVLTETLSQLAEYSVTHFDTEERLLREYDYPRLEEQHQAHESFMERTIELVQRIAKSPSAAEEETLAFLQSWWLRHIQRDDMKYKAFLLARGVR